MELIDIGINDKKNKENTTINIWRWRNIRRGVERMVGVIWWLTVVE